MHLHRFWHFVSEDNDDDVDDDGGGDDYQEKSWYEIICTAQGASISNFVFHILIQITL